MKKILVSIFFAIFVSANAQNASFLSKGNMLDGGLFYAKINSANGKTLEYSEIKGSPYTNPEFFSAKIAENYEKVNVRYNSYSDQVEYEKEDKVYTLPKETTFSKIEISSSPKQVLVMLNTNDEFSGYFYEIIDNKIGLYKKVKTKFTDTVPAANSYSSEKPASFKTLDPIYYIKTEKGFIKSPKNQKEILAQFPSKKDVLNRFFKENRVKFNNEEDLKKLVNFLNQN